MNSYSTFTLFSHALKQLNTQHKHQVNGKSDVLTRSASTQTHLVGYCIFRTHGMNFKLDSYVEVWTTCSSKHLHKDASFVTLKIELLCTERQKLLGLLYKKGSSFCNNLRRGTILSAIFVIWRKTADDCIGGFALWIIWYATQ